MLEMWPCALFCTLTHIWALIQGLLELVTVHSGTLFQARFCSIVSCGSLRFGASGTLFTFTSVGLVWVSKAQVAWELFGMSSCKLALTFAMHVCTMHGTFVAFLRENCICAMFAVVPCVFASMNLMSHNVSQHLPHAANGQLYHVLLHLLTAFFSKNIYSYGAVW